jgi:hypothetical protein
MKLLSSLATTKETLPQESNVSAVYVLFSGEYNMNETRRRMPTERFTFSTSHRAVLQGILTVDNLRSPPELSCTLFWK